MKTTKRISLFRYWTTRYAATLVIGLLFISISSVYWLHHTMLNNRLEVSEYIAEDLADRIAGSHRGENPSIENDILKNGELFLESEQPPAIYITDAAGLVLTGSQTMDIPKKKVFDLSLLKKKQDVQRFEQENNQAAKLYLIKKPIEVDDVIFGWVVMLQPENELTTNVNDEYRLLAIMIISLGLLGWAAIYLLSKRLSKPISQVAEAAKQVQEGNYDINLPSEMKEQEMYDLIHSFKNMASRLEKLETLRAELLAGVTHELKTPVTSISGLLQAVKEEVVTGEEAKEFIDISLKETAKMQKMINDLLEFNSFAANALPVSKEAHEANELMSDIIHQWKISQELENKEISLHLLPERRLLYTDPLRLQQIIVNLLNNAVQSLDGKGTIDISLFEQETGELTIEIKDNGTGIPFNEQSLVFERFYRGENKKYKVRGLGLGLPFSKLLAQALGGDLVLQKSDKNGTIFALTI